MKREEKEREEKTNLKTARYFPVYLPLNNSSTDDRAMFKKKRKKILEQKETKYLETKETICLFEFCGS